MFRKPSYCCNCGDRVERLEWHLWNSRRYCELCETEFVFDEWWPRGALLVLVLFGLTGIGFHWKGERPALESRYLSVPSTAGDSGNSAITFGTGKRTQALETREATIEPREQRGVSVIPPIEPAKEAGRRELEAEPVATPEVITYCGALTKKGTACSRRVKGGGRCWQHARPRE